jgi:hypothetical protein
MSHDILIRAAISTRSKNKVSYASTIYFPSFLSHDTKTSKVSEKDNSHEIYPKSFNYAFLKQNLRDIGIMLRRFDESQN